MTLYIFDFSEMSFKLTYLNGNIASGCRLGQHMYLFFPNGGENRGKITLFCVCFSPQRGVTHHPFVLSPITVISVSLGTFALTISTICSRWTGA